MIENGSYVIIQKIGGDHLRLNRVLKGQKMLIEKLKFNINGAIGRPYGLFEACAGQLAPLSQPSSASVMAIPDELVKVTENISASIADEKLKMALIKEIVEEHVEIGVEGVPTKRQKLTHVEIGALKEAGVSTTELISKLVDGNAAFQARTEYSQLKYKEKKSKKHSDRVLISKPTIRLLAESYYKRSPDRVAHLRIDLLGYILQMSAIHVSSRVFVYEQVLGLVAAAIVERLGGEGTCIFLHRYQVPQSIPCIYAMEFDEKQLSTFCPLRISALLGSTNPAATAEDATDSGAAKASTSATENGDENTQFADPISVDELTASVDDNAKADLDEDEEADSVVEDADEAADAAALEERRRQRAEHERTALELLRIGSSGFEDCGQLDSIVLAVGSVEAVDLLARTYASLRLSGTIIVYSAVQTVLSAYDWLKKRGAVDLQIVDQFFRYHQVLPDRTHPLMQQAVAGGYVLSGVKVKENNPTL